MSMSDNSMWSGGTAAGAALGGSGVGNTLGPQQQNFMMHGPGCTCNACQAKAGGLPSRDSMREEAYHIVMNMWRDFTYRYMPSDAMRYRGPTTPDPHALMEAMVRFAEDKMKRLNLAYESRFNSVTDQYEYDLNVLRAENRVLRYRMTKLAQQVAAKPVLTPHQRPPVSRVFREEMIDKLSEIT